MNGYILVKVLDIARDFKQQMKKKNISAFASSTAFFLFVSLIPMLILLCAIVPYTGITEADLMTFLTEITPDVVDSFMVSMIEGIYDQSAGIASIAALTLVWSAGKGMLAMIRGLNEINDVEEGRGYLALRGIASFYTVIMLLVTVMSLVVMVFGNVLMAAIIRAIPKTKQFFDFLLNFRLLFILVLMIIVFSMMYAYIPNKKLKLIFQIPGAVFSAVIWNVFSWAFSIYVERINGFSAYGNLATIVIIMLWLYMCIYIIMIGAYVNRYFAPIFHFLFIYRQARKRNSSDRSAHLLRRPCEYDSGVQKSHRRRRF